MALKLEEQLGNCLEVIRTERGWTPSRFTARQLANYDINEARRIRSGCSSGAMLDVRTDSRYIEIEYELGGRARPWVYFDVFVNDCFIASVGTDRCEQSEGRFRCDPGGAGMRRVTIYLPHLAELTIRAIRYSEGAAVEPAPSSAGGNLLCLGDSITQGMDAKYPSSAYPVLLSRFLGMRVLNHGVGGYVFDKSSLDPDLPFDPDLITVAYGTNDWGKYDSLAAFRRQCGEYLGALDELYPKARIAVITPIWRRDLEQAKPMGTFGELARAIADACAEFPRMRIIDGMTLVPHQLRYFGDGVHPNDEGFMHMTLGTIRHLNEMMRG